MIARIQESLKQKDDKGFTLIELLVVMIIIGILAAIAIPLFLSQRAKAEDAAAKADVSTIGKEVATYFVDGTGTAVISEGTAGYELNDEFFGIQSNNVVLGGQQDMDSSSEWCVWVTNEEGDVASDPGFEYSARGGLSEGNCGSGGGGASPTP